MNYSINEIKLSLQSQFDNSADLSVRVFTLKSALKIQAAVITMEGLVDKEQLSQSVLNPLLTFDYGARDSAAVSVIAYSSVMASSDVIKLSSADEIVTYITSGFAVLMIDGAEELYAVGVQGYSFRGVSEPESEVVQRGSREGFTEPLRVNMSMIRRRMKTPDLKFEQMTVGTDSKTQLMICYLQSQVSLDLLNKLKNRLSGCNLETVLASGYLSDYLEDNGSGSLFSGVGISERPDTVCGKLTEGRIAIIVDGTPAVMIVPHLFVEEFQSVDDYSNRTYYAAFIRLMKYLSFFVSVFLPGLYVALAQFHPEYFPTWLLINTSESLAQTPFPVTAEVLAITVVYEIMKEAGLRIPKSLGHAVSIVGALVIGDSAVNAGIISASTLMVVATAAICGYVTSPLYPPIMMLRMLFIVVGGFTGLWGITLATAVVLIGMCAKTSLGVPYLSSLSPFSLRRMRDVFIRAGWRQLSKHTIRVQKFPETEVQDANRG
ncbi:MAG: spore germination protein [Ruminococcus sp.]|uniref:spore germination protein n=1 Tax=Ruminococcus sp. TaxID=41978 RepID=UPI00164C8E6D|nr:spore germination protein [uncultured Ruminococcus sp.]MBQ2280617.1 spore germination protein [Ruminococcus sp.]MBQ2536960.1 spore germination protein [Ruminococcus sp.]MBQ4250750.1 spore germination protein [Ruminococcus sp.]MEE3474819.1 spore germination protein [Ruminococcus sp.]